MHFFFTGQTQAAEGRQLCFSTQLTDEKQHLPAHDSHTGSPQQRRYGWAEPYTNHIHALTNNKNSHKQWHDHYIHQYMTPQKKNQILFFLRLTNDRRNSRKWNLAQGFLLVPLILAVAATFLCAPAAHWTDWKDSFFCFRTFQRESFNPS